MALATRTYWCCVKRLLPRLYSPTMMWLNRRLFSVMPFPALVQEGRPVGYSPSVMNQIEQHLSNWKDNPCSFYEHVRNSTSAFLSQTLKFLSQTINRCQPYLRNPSAPLQSARNACGFVCRTITSKWNTDKEPPCSWLILRAEHTWKTNQNTIGRLDVRSIRERLFAYELEQTRQTEDLSFFPNRLKRLRDEKTKDAEMQILSDIISNGWPETLAHAREYGRPRRQDIELYINGRDVPTTEDGLAYKGHGLLIPVKQRPDIAKSLARDTSADNGPPFNNNEDFKTFNKEWDFNYITSCPCHAQGKAVLRMYR